MMETNPGCGHHIVSWSSSNKSLCSLARNKLNIFFSKKTLYKRFPILNWLPKYSVDDALGDFIAGITVGLTVIPQSLAYAGISGLPPEYGLYGSFLGAFIYIFFGSCKDVPFGPAAITGLMTYQTIGAKGLGIEHAILLTFFTGIIELLMGIFGLGFIIEFISRPVSSGFTSAVALVILTSQVKDIFTIEVSGNTFLQQWISIFQEIHNYKLPDAILGVSCIAVLLIVRAISLLQVGPKDQNERSNLHQIVNKAIWAVGALRNTFIIVICGFIGYVLTEMYTESPIKLIGYVPPGFPEVKPPPFGFESGNITVSFMQMMSDLGSGLIVVPLIALLENIAICKAFAHGKTVDATQELIALGISNIGNSFVQAYPSTGSVPRAAVNHASGVRTPLGGLYTGLLVILSLIFFTPYFSFIPKASLAAVIIAAVVFMVEIHVIKPMWKIRRQDLIPAGGTFILCLVLPLQVGILCGVGLNLLFILYISARPKILAETYTSVSGTRYLMLIPDRCLIFPSADYLRHIIAKNLSKNTNLPIILDCSFIYDMDYTTATVIESLHKDLQSKKKSLFFYNPRQNINEILTNLNLKDYICDKIENIDSCLITKIEENL